MGMQGWGDQKIETLSKGMSQKVQFVAAVVSKPELLILDEPFSGLDPVNAESLKDAVLEMRRRGTTVVFSTHDMATAEKMCDRIFMIFKRPEGARRHAGGNPGAVRLRHRAAAHRGGRRRRSPGSPASTRSTTTASCRRSACRCDPQRFLQQLAAKTAVHHFEITRPSLHDIFVRIAAPEGRDDEESACDVIAEASL